MAKANIGLVKTVGVTFNRKENYTEELEANLRDFLKDRGIDESTRRSSERYKFIEYDAEDMTVTWKRLEADLEESFPYLDTQYTEGTDDEQEEYVSEYENLEISN